TCLAREVSPASPWSQRCLVTAPVQSLAAKSAAASRSASEPSPHLHSRHIVGPRADARSNIRRNLTSANSLHAPPRRKPPSIQPRLLSRRLRLPLTVRSPAATRSPNLLGVRAILAL